MSEELKSYGEIIHGALCETYGDLFEKDYHKTPHEWKSAVERAAMWLRAAVIEREGLKPPASIWHRTAEVKPTEKDGDANGHIMCVSLFTDAPKRVPYHWLEVSASKFWCRVEDLLRACPLPSESLKSQHVADDFKANAEPQPDTSTLEGKIAVMQAALGGAEIEWRSRSPERGSDRWHPPVEASGGKILWNWIGCEYRVKPEPDPFAAFMAERHPNVERGSDDWQAFQDIWTAAKGGAE